jgi:hypothetical protein
MRTPHSSRATEPARFTRVMDKSMRSPWLRAFVDIGECGTLFEERRGNAA